jgi:dipeptidase
MEQQAMFTPTQHGEQPIQARLVSRRDDPQTSKDAARRVVATLTEQQQRAVAMVRAYGPGTTWEIATRYTGGGVWYDETVADIHYLLARRLPEAEVSCAVTCGRIKDAMGKTIRQDVKVCSVRGTKQAVWRVA